MRPLTRQLGGPTPSRSSLSFAPNSGSVHLEVSELLRAHSGPSARMPAVSPGEERDCPSAACLHSYSELQLPWARSCPGPRAGVAGRWAGRWGSTECWISHPRHGPRADHSVTTPGVTAPPPQEESSAWAQLHTGLGAPQSSICVGDPTLTPIHSYCSSGTGRGARPRGAQSGRQGLCHLPACVPSAASLPMFK